MEIVWLNHHHLVGYQCPEIDGAVLVDIRYINFYLIGRPWRQEVVLTNWLPSQDGMN